MAFPIKFIIFSIFKIMYRYNLRYVYYIGNFMFDIDCILHFCSLFYFTMNKSINPAYNNLLSSRIFYYKIVL